MNIVYYLKAKWVYILGFLMVLLAAAAIGGFFYFQAQAKIIDLTKGKVVDLKDNLGFYIEQTPEVCNQNNLGSFFKSFTVSGEAGAPTKSDLFPKYGEITWNYILQGEISKIQPVGSGIKYTLTSGENKLITQSTNNTIFLEKDQVASPGGDLVPKKVNASILALKDKVYLYYIVKCGGNRLPLLFLEYIQKIATPAPTNQTNQATSSSSAVIRSWSNGLSNFSGKVIGKGENFLTLEGTHETVKVMIPNNVQIKIIAKNDLFTSKTSSAKLSDYPNESISLIKQGELINVTGKYNGKILTASFIAVIR